ATNARTRSTKISNKITCFKGIRCLYNLIKKIFIHSIKLYWRFRLPLRAPLLRDCKSCLRSTRLMFVHCFLK
ncbi:unnamed protein product, partial [Tenebrio molitor]